MKKILQIILILLSTTAFATLNNKPRDVYRVYLKGESLGLIESKKELEDYIDKKQKEIKQKYKVKKVYAPTELSIVKEKTYNTNINSIKEIYSKINDKSPFTISGYVVKIDGTKNKTNEGKEKITPSQKIYVLKKNVFKNASKKTVLSFISEKEYKDYEDKTQKEIEDTGKIIENIYIQNKITIKKQNIPVNEEIFQNETDLSKYLLFGTTEPHDKYTIVEGDTIADVSFKNKLSTEEFLIANPELTDENSLLSPGQIVSLGNIKPQFNVVEEDHVVIKEEKNFTTKTEYDDTKEIGYKEVTQEGQKGENKVTQKIQKINGETTNIVTVSTEVIKETKDEIITKGGKEINYASNQGGGYGSAVPTRGEWGWPATCSTISSPFGWRWGALHDGTDIAGCGYGSNIFAAQSGTVEVSGSKEVNGQYILINHHNGYYTMYAHLCVGCRYVSSGQYVEKGQVIGGMGMTGAATGVHLHFAIWKGYPYRGGTALNAMQFY